MFYFYVKNCKAALGEKAETQSIVSLGVCCFCLCVCLEEVSKEINHSLYFLVLAGNGNRVVQKETVISS